MLHALEVENFFSIRTLQRVDLRVPLNAPNEPNRLVPIAQGASVRVPRVVAFFGANGAGKSTVLKAVNFIVSFARESFHWQPDQPLPFAPFNDGEAAANPTRFRLEFAAPERPMDSGENLAQAVYRYELDLLSSGQVLHEELSCKPLTARKPTRLFTRGRENVVKASPAFGLSSNYPYIDRVLRHNASLISTLAQLQHPFSLALRTLAGSVWSNIGLVKWETTDEATIPYYRNNAPLTEFFNREISRLDIGLLAISIVDTPNGPMAQFDHDGLVSPIPSYFESHGTRQFFRIFPFIAHALMTGGVAIIDELDTSIHPMLLPEIIGWFFNAGKNPHGAQLWMTAQSAPLLEELLKEEIYFCEKDRSGRTTVYGLRDVQRVRRVDNYYRKYLGGVYGAVPRVG